MAVLSPSAKRRPAPPSIPSLLLSLGGGQPQEREEASELPETQPPSPPELLYFRVRLKLEASFPARQEVLEGALDPLNHYGTRHIYYLTGIGIR